MSMDESEMRSYVHQPILTTSDNASRKVIPFEPMGTDHQHRMIEFQSLGSGIMQLEQV